MSEHHDSEVSQRVRDLERTLVQAGVLSENDVDEALREYLDHKGVITKGARLVARAWIDPEFREMLLSDGNEACRAIGIEWTGEEPLFRVVANDEKRHNLVVCTLCSCYPTGLLGPSPYWYRSVEYRARAVREPRAVLADFGFEPPTDVRIHVWDASADARYMVLPDRPVNTDDLSEEELADLVSVRGLIGTAPV